MFENNLPVNYLQAGLPENSILINGDFDNGLFFPWETFADAQVSLMAGQSYEAGNAWTCFVQCSAISRQSGIYQKFSIKDFAVKRFVAGCHVKVVSGEVVLSLHRDLDDAVIWQSAPVSSKEWTPVFSLENGILLQDLGDNIKIKLIGSQNASFYVDSVVVTPLADTLQEMARKLNKMMMSFSILNWLKAYQVQNSPYLLEIAPGVFFPYDKNAPLQFEGATINLEPYKPKANNKKWLYVCLDSSCSVKISEGDEYPNNPIKPLVQNASCPIAYVLLESDSEGELAPIQTIEDIRPFFKFFDEGRFGADGGGPCTLYNPEYSGLDGGSPRDDFILAPDIDTNQYPIQIPVATEVFAGIVKYSTYEAIALGIGDGVVRAKHLRTFINNYTTGTVNKLVPEFPWNEDGDGYQGYNRHLITNDSGESQWAVPGPKHDLFQSDYPALAAGQIITVPKYNVGCNNLWVFLDGCKCALNHSYQEVGNEKSQSTQIRWLDPLPAGHDFEFIVW